MRIILIISGISLLLMAAGIYSGDPSFEQAVFIDKRDTESYLTVTFSGEEWLAENLSFTGHFKKGKDFICNDEDNDLCERYGRMYSWDAMSKKKVKPGMRSICPKGWHLPTKVEWMNMVNNINEEKVISVRLIKDGGDTGLDLTLSGRMNAKNGLIEDLDRVGYYWTSSTENGKPVIFYIWSNTDYDTKAYEEGMYALCRCVRN